VDASKEKLLEIYKLRYEVEEMPGPRITAPATSAAAPSPVPPPNDSPFLMTARAAAAARRGEPLPFPPPLNEGDTEMTDSSAQPAAPCSDKPFLLTIKSTLETVFVASWSKFLKQAEENATDDRLARLSKSQAVVKSAEETALEIDSEMSMNAENMSRYIDQKISSGVAAKTKDLERKLARIEKSNTRGGSTSNPTDSSKNRTRGQGGATKKKKSAQANQKSQRGQSDSKDNPKSILRNPSRGRGAGAAGNAGRGGGRGRGRNRSGRGSQQNRQTSGTGRGRSQGQSTRK